nr:hypothetical protein [bacterium]
TLSIGCACARKIEIGCWYPGFNTGYVGAEMAVDIGLLLDDAVEWCQVGVFAIDEITSQDDFKTVNIVGYDKMAKLTDPYTTAIASWPAAFSDICDEIAETCGFEYAAGTVFPDYTIPAGDYGRYTYREMLGYLAGCMGKNARFNGDGKCEFSFYTQTGVTIGRGIQYMDGLKKTGDPITVMSLSSGTDENPIASGVGKGIAFVNPLITQEMLDAALADIVGFTYLPCTMHWRGCPAIRAGDMVLVTDADGVDHNVPILEQTIAVDGGMECNITCGAESETAYAFDQNRPSDVKLNRVYSAVQQSIIDATERITGQNGGAVVTRYDENGLPYELLIMNTPDIASATQVWRWNTAGLGYSDTGYNGVYETAITSDGKIVADFIATGTLSADLISAFNHIMAGDPEKQRLELGLDDGRNPFLSVYNADGDLTLRLTNNAVDFTDDLQLKKYAFGTRVGLGIFVR